MPGSLLLWLPLLVVVIVSVHTTTVAAAAAAASSSSSLSSLSSSSLEQCQVWDAEGNDVTSNVLTTSSSSDSESSLQVGTIRSNEAALVVEGYYVECNGNFACRGFTIANCPAVKCWGLEACFEADLLNVTHVVECDGMHSCHRATIHFAEATSETLSSSSSSSPSQQTITCSGEGACDVTQLVATRAHLECRGRKACRKINAQIDVVHCTEGDSSYEACTGYASLQANCILCGWLGCNEHVNQCRTKHFTETAAEERWVACKPHTAVGPGCTAAQSDQVAQEVAAHN